MHISRAESRPRSHPQGEVRPRGHPGATGDPEPLDDALDPEEVHLPRVRAGRRCQGTGDVSLGQEPASFERRSSERGRSKGDACGGS